MTEVRFYQIKNTPELQVLPQIAYKAWQSGKRVLIKAGDDAQLAQLNDALWTFNPDAFLPHGAKDDGFESRQPVWIITTDENPNGARILVLAIGCTCADVAAYDLCCVMVDGHNEQQREEAKTLWRSYKAAGHSLTYWEQTDSGWQKKN